MKLFLVALCICVLSPSSRVGAEEKPTPTNKSSASTQAPSVIIPQPLKIDADVSLRKTPQEIEKEQQEKKDREKSEAETLAVAKDNAEASWRSGNAAAVAAFIAFLSMVIAWLQLGAFKRSLKQTTKSISLTQDALDHEAKPYLYTELELISNSPSLTQAAGEIMYGISVTGLRLRRFNISISNAGRSPAIVTEWHYKLIVWPHGQEISHAINPNNETGTGLPNIIVAPEKSFSEEIRFDELTDTTEVLSSVVDTTNTIWVCGFFRYKNSLGTRYVLGFNYAFDLIRGKFVQRGSDSYNYDRKDTTPID